ncbi:hypothetical protein HU200_046046 [Digitaria exilis]|uniref:EF-hand domain-containing protein n=1 Tax=Digitaria exilis TaxID=1010633 RepID=A0A835B231_9POAL|nr:hypothetical protein HU200_046046 [Digitaria exilis]
MPIRMDERPRKVHLPATVYNNNGIKDHGHGSQDPAGMAMAAAVPPPNWRSPGKEHRSEITVPEFRRWLKQFDTNHDGLISRKELREAIRHRGAWFAGLRALFAIQRADHNHNGFVDDSEIEGLIQFAERELGFRINTDAPPAGHVSGSRVMMSSPAAAPPPLYRSTTYMAY